MLHLILPRRIPSRRRLVNTIPVLQKEKAANPSIRRLDDL
jgi:hypothetical protein